MSSPQPVTMPVEQVLWFTQTVYSISIVLIIFFGLIGIYLALKDTSATKNMKQFIAATRSSGLLIISFAFFGTTLGTSGVFIFASNVTVQKGGWLQVTSQAVYTAIAPLVVAVGGWYIISTKQDVVSFIHFLRYRFGIVTFILTILVMLLDMAIVLMQEYLSISQIFLVIVDPQNVIARPDIMIVIILAGVVALYTALGGLKVSLVTDLFQCGFTAILTVLIIIYLAVTFRKPLTPQRYQSLQLGRGNQVGRNSWASNLQAIFIIFYQEENWQRVWASKNSKTMLLGALIGGIMGGILAFLAGVAGLLSSWADLPYLDDLGNLSLFTVFSGQLSSWGVIIMILLFVSLSESFVDSLQNGMVASITTVVVAFKEQQQYTQRNRLRANKDSDQYAYEYQHQLENEFAKVSLEYSQKQKGFFHLDIKTWFGNFKRTFGIRIAVVLLQFILVPVALRGFSLVQLNYIIGQLVTIMFSGQVMGLFISPRYYTQMESLAAWLLAFFAPYIYSYIYLKNGFGPENFGAKPARNIFIYTWDNLINLNDYGIMLTILFTGLIASGFFITCNILYRLYRGELNRKNYYQELFLYNAKTYYMNQRFKI